MAPLCVCAAPLRQAYHAPAGLAESVSAASLRERFACRAEPGYHQRRTPRLFSQGETAMTNRMAYAAAAVLAALALLAPATATRAADEFKLEDGFTRLDTGKDLEGWTGNLDG